MKAPAVTRTRVARSGAGLLTLLLAAGCAGDPTVEASTVLQYGRCEGLQAGVERVSYPDVASIRGSRLIRVEPSAEPGGNAPRGDGDTAGRGAPDADGDPAAVAAPTETAGDGGAPLLVAISRGRQPTPGYSFSLEGAHRRDRTAVVTVRWQTPEPDAVLAQVMTHPCLVVALPKADFTRVEVVDTDGETLGTLEL